MSYQPQPPMGGLPPMAAPTPAPLPMAPASAGPSGKGGKIAGLALIVVGLGAGGALIALSGSNKEETIKKFARAPVGCTTTLEFDKATSFTLYLETKGSVQDVGGDCEQNGASYDSRQEDAPDVTITLVDADDNEISMDDASGPSYDAGGYVGVGLKTVRIADAGTYRLTVASEQGDFAIAIGGDPDGDSGTMMIAGVASAVGGLALGLLLLLRGRKSATPPPPAPVWQQAPAAGGWPTQPTVPGYQPAPPVAQPPAAPPAPPVGPGWGAPHQ